MTAEERAAWVGREVRRACAAYPMPAPAVVLDPSCIYGAAAMAVGCASFSPARWVVHVSRMAVEGRGMWAKHPPLDDAAWAEIACHEVAHYLSPPHRHPRKVRLDTHGPAFCFALIRLVRVAHPGIVLPPDAATLKVRRLDDAITNALRASPQSRTAPVGGA